MDKMNSFLKTHKLKRKKKALYLNRPTERKRVDEPINKNLLQNNPHAHMASRGKKNLPDQEGNETSSYKVLSECKGESPSKATWRYQRRSTEHASQTWTQKSF